MRLSGGGSPDSTHRGKAEPKTNVGHIMLGTSHPGRAADPHGTKYRLALIALVEAFDFAQDTQCDVWEFAVAIRRLQALGLNESDLRWLVCKGFVEHAREVTRGEDRHRKFRSVENLCFCKKTHFALTPSGVELGRSLIPCDVGNASRGVRGASLSRMDFERSKTLPSWNPDTRELRLLDRIVKRFKWQAVNQEIVLGAFQEDNWPVVIEDPLPPKCDQPPKRRLHDTIKALNRNQLHSVIRFHGNGTGEGIRWEMIDTLNGASR